MAVNGQLLQPLHRIGQPVTAGIEIRVVDLIRITGQHHFRPLAGPADDGLDLMRGEVLRLIDNHKLAGNRPAPDIGQGLQFHHVVLQQLFHLQARAIILPVLRRLAAAHEKGEVVKNGLHPVRQFFVLVAGHIAQVLAERNDRPGDKDLFIALVDNHLFQSSGKGEQGLAGAGLAHQRYNFDTRIKQKFQAHALFLAAGADLPG